MRSFPPERIVCLTEETVETLYLLGEDRRIVGVSGYAVRPKQVRAEKPRVAAFTSADIPKILALEPDLVLAFSDLQAEIARDLAKAGVEVHLFNQRDVAGILRMIVTLGALVGASARAEALAGELAEGLDRARAAAERFPRRPRVYFEEWDAPMIAGIGWVSELVEIAGGIDCFADLARRPLASERVIADLSAALEQWPAQATERCEAMYLIARSHTKLRQHSADTPIYDRILDACSETDWELRALYLGGRGRWNSGDRQGALKLFERIWEEYSDHSYADDAMYFAGRILRSEDQPIEARQRLTAQLERYPEGDMAKDAHWLLVREFFDNDDFQAVIDHVDALEKTGEDDLYTKGRLHYFRARALLQSDRTDEAARAFIEVTQAHPMSYYALLSYNQLARLQGDTAGLDICATVGPACEDHLPPNLSAEPIALPDALQNDAGFHKASQLLTLGLTSLAQRELTALRTRHASDNTTLWALASLLDAAHAYPISHDLARRHISGWMDAYPTQSTRRFWSIAYPTPFKDALTRYAEQRSIDPAIIYAIMREESGFNPRVESWANARGLLLLIEPTARRIAQKDGLSDFSFDLLFDPTINIRLGSAYMRELADQTNTHPALIIAGYNGGFGNVSTWLKDFGHEDLDLFVENIPFGQTRDYTKRVLMSFWIYSYLYGDARVPALSFTLPAP